MVEENGLICQGSGVSVSSPCSSKDLCMQRLCLEIIFWDRVKLDSNPLITRTKGMHEIDNKRENKFNKFNKKDYVIRL